MGSEEAPGAARQVVTRLVVPVVIGVAVAVAPMWVMLGNELEPSGERCWYEMDPGSGRSSLGEERVEWGIAPYRSCVPVDGEDVVSERALAHNRTFPIYGRAWPFAAAFVALLVAAAQWQRRADRDTLDAMDDPDL